jgi:formate C-acetyltransferase
MSDAISERFRLTPRLRELAQEAARRGANPLPCLRTENQTRAYFELYQDLPLRERQARSFAYALVNEPVRLYPGERANGIFYGGADPQLYGGVGWGEHAATPTAQRRIAEEIPELTALADQWPERKPEPGKASYLLDTGAAPGHIAWNYDLILSLGVEGLVERHRDALRRTDDPEARAYYQGVLSCLDAVLEWNRRHVEELRRMLDCAETPEERAFLEGNLHVMERVPAEPARNFREAIQSFYFQWLCVMYEEPYGGNSPGRLDYFLWPCLQREYDAGELCYQEAGELVAELFLKMDERVHLQDGHVNTIVVGGLKPDGTDGVNPLSYLMLDVFEQLSLTHPAVYARISDTNPPEWTDRCVAYMLNGGNRAQLLADEPIIRAMARDGRLPFEDAAMYMCGGCMELNPHGMNSDLLWTFTYNVPKTLELLITGGECLTTGQKQRLAMPGSLRDFADFESFYAAFEGELRRALHAKFRCLDIHSEEMARCRPAFLQSSMVADCLERGRNLQDGGARYADYGGTPCGLQNVADSLYALKRAVLDEGFCSAEELLDALRADFAGHGPLHRHLLALPKYGQGDPDADAMMDRVLTSVCAIFDSYRNRHGGRVKPIIFTFVWAPEMGRSLGASPDGRKAGQPIAHGLTPQAAGMTEGLTTAINSLGTLTHDVVSGGASTMWDMDATWINHPLLKSIVTTFVQKGGHIFQGNTTSVADLEAALADPAAYAHLIVRVGGFSARFVNLARPLQVEILERHRHRG